MNRFQSLELFDVVIANTDLAYFALLLQVYHRLPGFFDVVVRIRPVHLVEINRFNAQASKTILTLGNDGLAFDVRPN